jgi:hypothetical protein
MTATKTESLKCAIPHASPAGIYTHGQIVGADDPGVLYNPGAFVPLHTPDAEMPHPLDAHIQRLTDKEARRRAEEREAFLAEAKLNPLKLSGPELVRLTKDLPTRWGGRPVTLKKGSILEANETVVLENPDLFRPV